MTGMIKASRVVFLCVTWRYFPHAEPWWTSKTDTAGESQTDGRETLAPTPETSLLIRREILRVKTWFHLILHLEDPGLSSKRRHPPTRHSRNVQWCSTFHILCKQEGKTTTCTSHYWAVLHRSWHSDIRHWYREASGHRGHQGRLSHGRSQDKMETRTFEAVRSSHVFSILNIWNIFWIVGFSTLKSYCCCYLV